MIAGLLTQNYSARMMVLILLTGATANSLATPMLPASQSPEDSAAMTTHHWQHLVRDDLALRSLGGQDAIAGMNVLGALGYELYMVTTSSDEGAAGFHFFRREPWNQPVDRPKFEYNRLSHTDLEGLGGGDFDAGLAAFETDRWQLIQITQTRSGGIGWYYFVRPLLGVANIPRP